MRIVQNLAIVHIVIILTVEITYGRDLRDLREITDPRDPDTAHGLLLSALCIQDGQLRKACLEDISSLSIQKFLEKMVEQIRDKDRYGSILQDLDLDDKDDVIPPDDVVPEKRGRSRSRNTSGFYSNW
ncbi:hypothetical protein ACF0H5_024048 [Mactra antiquata]